MDESRRSTELEPSRRRVTRYVRLASLFQQFLSGTSPVGYQNSDYQYFPRSMVPGPRFIN